MKKTDLNFNNSYSDVCNDILGVANNDTTSNRSILNGGVRARMRLHGAENVASNSLSNGHAVSPTDKSVVFLSGRHAVSLLDGRQISRTDMSTPGIDGRIGGSAEQFSKISASEGRNNVSPVEQSILPGAVGISRSDQLLATNIDIRSHNRTELSAPSGRNSRTEQLIATPIADSFGAVRADQLSTPLVDGCVASRVDQPTTSTLTDDQGISHLEQPALFTLPDGTSVSHLEQAGVCQTVQNSSEQSTALPMAEGRRLPRSDQAATSASNARSNPRVVQRVASLTGQTAMLPGQSAPQSGPSIILAEVEPTNHSEEPLPPGWEVRYDIYRRRLYYFKTLYNEVIFR